MAYSKTLPGQVAKNATYESTEQLGPLPRDWPGVIY